MTSSAARIVAVEDLISKACRAPSLHNSQPWKWVLDKNTVRLHADATRLLPITDSAGRQLLISCGAALNHLRVAAAAAGFDTKITRLPDPNDRNHLATIELTAAEKVSDDDLSRGAAIARRRTDRLAFYPPQRWGTVFDALGDIATNFGTHIDVVAPRRRAELAHVSAQAASQHRYDSDYKAEMQWWTGRSTKRDGVPTVAMPSRAEASRVQVGRAFPAAERQPMQRVEIGLDRSKILILTTPGDTRIEWLRCGEALSAILLECTVRGLATCPLTHMTELAGSRDLIRQMLSEPGVPQVIIRVGSAASAATDQTTRRRPLSEVLEVVPVASSPARS